jgi:hypothetical protein
MKKNVFFLLFFLAFSLVAPVQATTFITDIFVDTPTISKGYTVVSEDQNFRLGIYPEVLAVETRVVVKQFEQTDYTYPEGWRAISDVYEFDIFNKAAFQDEKPLKIRINTFEETRHLKKIHFYNGVIDEWVELPSETVDLQTIKSILHLPYAKMVVLEHDEILEIGDASWYGYKGCLCAASPDYPKGTVLNVKDLDTQKEVQVTVNDYGPDRSIFPMRVIDLDKVAFKELGWLGYGVLKNILVTKIK